MDSQTSSLQGQIEDFATNLQRVDETTFCGYIFWHRSPLTRFVVEIALDGEPVGLVRAEQFEQQLLESKFGDGCYGFTFVARKQQLVGHRLMEARIANLRVPVGQPIDLALDTYIPQTFRGPGLVEWVGGLRFVGTANSIDEHSDSSIIRVFDGDIVVAETQALTWSRGRQVPNSVGSLHFDLHLPLDYADGLVHVFRVKNERNQELNGSPLTIQAFNDGLRRYMEDAGIAPGDEPRAQWFDRFLPMSIPFEAYEEWRRRFSSPTPTAKQRQAIRVVMIGESDAEDAVGRLLTQAHQNWSAASVPSPDGVSFDWADLRSALIVDEAEHDVAVFVSSKTVLRTDALVILADALLDNEDALAACCDVDIINRDGTVQPLFFGAFDYERLLEQGYAAQCFALRTSAIKFPQNEASGSLVRLLLALFDESVIENCKRVIHIPGALARVTAEDLMESGRVLKPAVVSHMRQRGVAVEIAGAKSGLLPAIHVKRKHNRDDVVSIVIPTRDRVDVLSACIDSVRKKTENVKYEIIIVDNGSSTKATLDYLESCKKRGDRVVNAPGAFNYSHLNNRGVAEARGDFVCLLNNDTEIIQSHWLEELLSRMAESDIGAVAPVLLWPNNMVQHGGIVLGPNFAASDAFNDCMDGDPGYADLLCVAHESSAVTAACLLTWRHDYLAVGGFDELAFPVLFNDVDFCLRLRAAGKRILLTPHAKLIHHESTSRQRDLSYDRASRFKRELAKLRNRWGAVIADDPAYSPFLNLDPYPFSNLAWPPRQAAPRYNRPVKPRQF